MLPLTLCFSTHIYAFRIYGQQKDEERTKQLIAMLEKNLAAYEVILGKTKCLAGDVSTIDLLGNFSHSSSNSVITAFQEPRDVSSAHHLATFGVACKPLNPSCVSRI